MLGVVAPPPVPAMRTRRVLGGDVADARPAWDRSSRRGGRPYWTVKPVNPSNSRVCRAGTASTRRRPALRSATASGLSHSRGLVDVVVERMRRFATGRRSASEVSSSSSPPRPSRASARLTASAMPVFMPWPPTGECVWAASPATKTLPTRSRSTERVERKNADDQLTESRRTSRPGKSSRSCCSSSRGRPGAGDPVVEAGQRQRDAVRAVRPAPDDEEAARGEHEGAAIVRQRHPELRDGVHHVHALRAGAIEGEPQQAARRRVRPSAATTYRARTADRAPSALRRSTSTRPGAWVRPVSSSGRWTSTPSPRRWVSRMSSISLCGRRSE